MQEVCATKLSPCGIVHVRPDLIMIGRWTKSDGVAGKFAQHALALALEKAAILALAFCHSHQLAVQDMVQYEKLEEWGPEDDFGAGHMGLAADTALEHMKHNVTEQVGSTAWICGCHPGWQYSAPGFFRLFGGPGQTATRRSVEFCLTKHGCQAR